MIPWRRKWQPAPVFLPGKFHGKRSLAGYSLQGCKELDTTEQLSTPSTHTVYSNIAFSSVSSAAQSCPTLPPHESQHARPPCPSPTSGVHSDSTSIESVMPSSHLILCRLLLLLPPIPPSIRVFSNESTLRMRWSKY